MEKEINEINDYLNITCSNNPVEIQERISVIMVYLNRSGEMLADAKKLLRKKKKAAGPSPTPSTKLFRPLGKT